MSADDRIDALFAGSADEFIAARDALVKALKAEGDKETAAEVKALRRPTVAAWAVNQVARKAKKDVAELVQIGDRLRDAHDALLEGRGDADVRRATADRRKLVAKLTRQAVALLGAGGGAQAEAITHTFDAAVADPDAGGAVRAGRLSKELQAPSGFGGGLVFGSAEPAAPSARREERRAARRSRNGAPTAAAPAPAPDETGHGDGDGDGVRTDSTSTPSAADARGAAAEAKAVAKEAERRRRELEREAEERAAEAQQAAREAAAARQEVSRLQDLLVTANARAKSAAEKAQLAQWKASTAKQSLREAEAEATAE